MFNIKSIVKQITERSRDSNIESPSKEDPNLQKTEGFLCPKCMKQLPSPWELQSHYESVHEEDMPSEFGTHSLSGIQGSMSSLDEGADQCAVEQDVSACGEGINSSLSVEDVPFITDVQDLQDKLQQALSRKATLETRVVRLVQSNMTLKAAVDDVDRELTQLRERHKILEAQLAHRESIDDAAVLRQELVQVQRVMDEMNREREKERDDLQAKLTQLQERDTTDSLVESLKSALSVKELECKQHCEEFENLKTKYEILMSKVENAEKCKHCSSEPGEMVLVAEDSSGLLQASGVTVREHREKEVPSSSGESLNEEQSRESVVAQYAETQKLYAETQKLLESKSIELMNLTRNFNEIKNEQMRKNEELTRICSEYETAKCNFESEVKGLEEKHKVVNDQLIKEKKICFNFSTIVKRLSEEKTEIESKLSNSLRECSAAQSLVSDLQQALAELQDEYQNVLAEHEQQRQELRQTIQEKSELLQKQEDAVQLLVSECAELTRKLESLETKKQRESEEAAQKLEMLQSELKEKAEKHHNLEGCLLTETKKTHSLQDKLTKLNESSSAAIEAKNEEIKVLKTSLDEMTGEKLALEAQIEATGSEQQKLLERWYASTSEIENLQHTVCDLRRKWEESESALQELGRENATLQLDIEKLLARKWAEDADVAECTLCHREFTMLLRKHHCRNCGQIFCNECSSKTAAVVSNKKPVRVCDSCYTELRTK